MAETFPFPAFERIGLQVRSGIASARDRGGLLITARRVEPSWGGAFTTDKLGHPDWSDAIAFLDNCVERNLRVDFVHPRHIVPRFYTVGTWPLASDPVLVSVTHGRQIVVSGLQVGMTLKRNDRFALIQGAAVCYRRLAADLTVVSSTVQALTVSPRLPLGVFTAGAAVRFRNPPVRLAIVPDSYQADEVYEQSAITFETEEALV